MRDVLERRLREPDGVLAVPSRDIRCAVLVLAGSSGRVELARVRLLAAHGAAALSVRWFGDPGQPPGICEVPLESFQSSLDALRAIHPRVAVIGTSKGGEAALLLGSLEPSVAFVAALSPSSLVWANVGPGRDGLDRPQRSSWTWRGTPLPFVSYDDTWSPVSASRPAFRGLYEQSMVADAAVVAAAAIPVEKITGDLLVSAGGDDQVWPADRFVEQIRERRERHGLATEVLTHRGAGHRVVLPGEAPASGGADLARGGTDVADRALGAEVWRSLQAALDLD